MNLVSALLTAWVPSSRTLQSPQAAVSTTLQDKLPASKLYHRSLDVDTSVVLDQINPIIDPPNDIEPRIRLPRIQPVIPVSVASWLP